MKRRTWVAFLVWWVATMATAQPIDRKMVVRRNNPYIGAIDSLSSLTVGNGHFAMTVDATGLQTFPERYQKGIPLGTMSDWGWHSFPNTRGYRAEEAFVTEDFGRGHQEIYSTDEQADQRKRDAVAYLRANAHRLHLGMIGLDLEQPEKVNHVDQTLDMWTGTIHSWFKYGDTDYHVTTVCNPEADGIATTIKADEDITLSLRFPYPTGQHTDDACDWHADSLHTTEIISRGAQQAVLRRTLDETVYYVTLTWTGKAKLEISGRNSLKLRANGHAVDVTCTFSEEEPTRAAGVAQNTTDRIIQSSANHWAAFWMTGGIIDLGQVKDKRAKELERRIVLSQYLIAAQEAGNTPPQETGLTYNSWFGKFHLEMIWWHQAHFALMGHPELLDRSLSWYLKVEPKAREIARRQGFKGVRWMKMTDPSAEEAPSKIGSYLIWQQPHLIYLAELLYRAGMNGVLEKYGRLVEETATFMADFAKYDSVGRRFILNGCIPAQETLKAEEVVNPPFELSYWLTAMKMAQQWRERQGKERHQEWDRLINSLSTLAANDDSLYLAAETAKDTYSDIRFTSDHPALLGAMGMMPKSRLVNDTIMTKTLDWIWDNWNWDKTWGWDYPMTAMTCARLGQRERAVDALLMLQRTNTYLVNGHNYQDNRLRCYLPGNGGLLIAAAMMCAGWDSTTGYSPGFPSDWDVRWENILPIP